MALFISTLGMLMATIDGSIVLISLPNIFRGIEHRSPRRQGNTFFLLWMILGFLVVTSAAGRDPRAGGGNLAGRVRIYNLGSQYAVFTFFSPDAVRPPGWTAMPRALWLIVMRDLPGGRRRPCLMANSAAILTDVFPDNQRGLALGVNQAAAFSGHVHRPRAGWLAGAAQLAVDLPRVECPLGLVGTIMGLPRNSTRRAPPPAGPDRLARQSHLRRRPDLWS